MFAYKLKKRSRLGLQNMINWLDKWPYFLGLKRQNIHMPDFIIAGIPKCGTVWLADTLKQHPEIHYVENPFYKEKREVRFFTLYFNFPIKAYFKAFKKQDPQQLYFEKSPDYAIMSKTRLKLIKRLKPDIKLIFVFRDPVMRSYSHAKMDWTRDHGIALTKETEHLYFKNYRNMSKYNDYESIIDKWESVFSKDQMLYMSLEDLKQNPSLTFDYIVDFLALKDKSFKFHFPAPKNTSKSINIPDHHKAYIKNYKPSYIKFWEEHQSLLSVLKKE